MWVARTVEECRAERARLSGRVVFVPTMGALHAGHASLIERARREGDAVIVSVFVNPTQFGPNEDFHRYPRPIEKDLALCEAAGAAGVFNPGVETMYPPGATACEVTIPALASILEGAARPGHFAGVCRVVAKLLHIVRPDSAVFGQKDYQQLRVIEAMVHDLHMPIRLIPAPTLRETDGLAMSSRNAYLAPEPRARAVGLFKALSLAQHMVRDQGRRDPGPIEAAMARVLADHGIEVGYAAVRHPRTLASIDAISNDGAVALLAGKLAGVRLIDNMPLPGAE